MVERKTVLPDKLRRNTPWGTDEFGCYDLNGNGVFFVAGDVVDADDAVNAVVT